MQNIEHLTMGSCPSDKTLTSNGCITTTLLQDECPNNTIKFMRIIIDPVTGVNLPNKYTCANNQNESNEIIGTIPSCPNNLYNRNPISNLENPINKYACYTNARKICSNGANLDGDFCSNGEEPKYTCPNDKILYRDQCY
jgi:hypothetical protein